MTAQMHYIQLYLGDGEHITILTQFTPEEVRARIKKIFQEEEETPSFWAAIEQISEARGDIPEDRKELSGVAAFDREEALRELHSIPPYPEAKIVVPLDDKLRERDEKANRKIRCENAIRRAIEDLKRFDDLPGMKDLIASLKQRLTTGGGTHEGR
jgi:aminoglycoside phosphotransferase (APT) family kinase protein